MEDSGSVAQGCGFVIEERSRSQHELAAPRSWESKKPSAKCQVTKALGELHSLISLSI